MQKSEIKMVDWQVLRFMSMLHFQVYSLLFQVILITQFQAIMYQLNLTSLSLVYILKEKQEKDIMI